MGFDCNTNCPIPLLMPGNMTSWDIISKFGSLMYDGESISATAIELAMVWYNVSSEHKSVVAQKISSFYATLRHKSSESVEDQTKNNSGRSTNTWRKAK